LIPSQLDGAEEVGKIPDKDKISCGEKILQGEMSGAGVMLRALSRSALVT
jgi:hypothetical protein